VNLNKVIVVFQDNTKQLGGTNYFPLLWWCFFVRISFVQSSTKWQYSAQYYSTPPPATRRDCLAASNYKHSGWCVPFPSVFYTAVWRRSGWGGVLSDRNGWLWPWHQLPVSLFPAARPPPCPISSAPWLPNNNSCALAMQPCWVFWDCRDNEHEALQTHASTATRQADRAYCSPGVESSQYDPAPPRSIVDQRCYEKGSTVYEVTVKIQQCSRLFCNFTRMERNDVLVHFLIWCQIWFHWCSSCRLSLLSSIQMTWCLTNSPLLFRTREDVIEPSIKPRVSPHSMSKVTGVSRATGTTHPADRQPGRCDLRAGSGSSAPHYH